MKKIIATIPAVVEPRSGDWYLYFAVRDPQTDKMVPIKIYRGFKKCKTVAEKRAWGRQLAADYDQKLRAGWSPLYDTDKVIYSDQVEYKLLSAKYSRVKSTVRNTRYYMSEYLAWKLQSMKPKTQSTYTSKVRLFCNWIEANSYRDYDVSAIDNQIVTDFFASINYLDRITVKKYLQIIRDYFNWMKSKGRIQLNPVFDIQLPPKIRDEAARPLGADDLKLLLEKIEKEDPQLYLACMMQYYLAIRPGNELRGLRVMDINLFSKTVVISDMTAKVRRSTIDLPDMLAELIKNQNIMNYDRNFYVFGRKHCPGPEMMGLNTLRNRFNAFRDNLNLPPIYKFYSMKHTGGGRLLEEGFTIEEIRDHMRHKNIESTDHYVRRHFGNRNGKIIESFPKPY
jgi:integrase